MLNVLTILLLKTYKFCNYVRALPFTSVRVKINVYFVIKTYFFILYTYFSKHLISDYLFYIIFY